ncbi:MAG: FtsX-like permease family protein, partial [Phycisphaerae bacterium]|nr:FtsX-like permease family protein [Phycisphaerae bacterium]
GTKCTMIFLNLANGADPASTRQAVAEDIGQDVIFVSSYRDMLASRWAPMFTYVNIVNTVALMIAFLFAMTTLYTMVLERTRDIAILKSCGAGRAFVIWQIVAEGLLLTASGMVIGLALSAMADWAVERYTLLTIDISPRWIGMATLAALAGAIASSLYPAWRATRVDMAEVLTYE